MRRILWGQNTYTTQDKVKEEIGEKSAHVCVIGPAGEKEVLFASILCDHGRMSGRTGMGAVMGSRRISRRSRCMAPIRSRCSILRRMRRCARKRIGR